MKLYLGVKGCSDHACILQDNSHGMHTNGGCRCAKEVLRVGIVGRDTVRTIRMLREELKAARAEIERLKSKNNDLKKRLYSILDSADDPHKRS